MAADALAEKEENSSEGTTNGEGEGGSQAKPKKKLPLVEILIFVFVALNLVSSGMQWYLLKGMWARILDVESTLEAQQEEEEASRKQAQEEVLGKELEPKNIGVLYPLDAFLVNINSDQGPKFLQVQLELELSSPSLEDEVSRKKPAIRDAIILLLSSRTFRELRDKEGLERLRQDLIKTVDSLLVQGKIKEVYFTQFHFN